MEASRPDKLANTVEKQQNGYVTNKVGDENWHQRLSLDFHIYAMANMFLHKSLCTI